ncbi:MAG: hypothetical protein IKM32_05950, partial [Clostridia bacterium]|nr:hypothetical protein [Clostridia bacterium]
KREERKEKSEKNKKKRQSSVENCRFFLVRLMGLFVRYHCLPHYSIMLTQFRSQTCGEQNVSPTRFAFALQVPSKTIKKQTPYWVFAFLWCG